MEIKRRDRERGQIPGGFSQSVLVQKIAQAGIGLQPAAARFTARLPHPYPWPAHLGPADGTSIVLALDAADGHPRWSELGGQQVTFAPAEGAVCELVTAGLECRDDATGAATLPGLVTRQASGAPPMADVSGSVAIVADKPNRAGEVTLRIVKIRGGATAAQARLVTNVNGYESADDRVVLAEKYADHGSGMPRSNPSSRSIDSRKLAASISLVRRALSIINAG